MQAKRSYRFLASMLAFLVMLSAIPFTPMTLRAGAAGTTYVLEASSLDTVSDKGKFTDGQEIKAGTGDYFTIYASKDTRFDSSKKTFDDGYSSGQRINFAGGVNVNVPKDCIGFTTGAAATVKVWWVSNDDNGARQIAVFNSAGDKVAETNETTVMKNETRVNTLSLPAAGKYFLGGTPKANYIFKAEVTEEAAVKESVLEASSLETVPDKGTFTDGQEIKAGTDDYFTIYASKDTRFDKSSKTFDDGYASAQRINFAGGANVNVPKDCIGFTTGGEAEVKVWWVSNDDNGARQIAIFNSAGDKIASTNETTVMKNETRVNTLTVPAAGKYFLGGTPKANYIFKVVVTEGGSSAPAVRADWSTVADPVIASAVQSGSEISVTINAIVGNDGGDEVKAVMTDSTGKELESKRSIKETSEHSLTFTPTASGTYTFTAVLSRADETDKAAAPVAKCQGLFHHFLIVECKNITPNSFEFW